MFKEPWLADLPDEDWVSQPPSPCPLGPHSPQLTPSPANQSARKCIGCSHRSRIPKTSENSSPKVRGGHTPRGSRQGQVKRGGGATPSSQSSPRVSITLNSPAKSAKKPNAKQATPSGKKPPSTLKNMVSAMSSSRISAHSADQGTIQIRPAQEDSQGTLEYRRRLIRGEMTGDEQPDLFAPMGLENMFKRPPTGSESALQPSFAVLDQANSDNQNTSHGSLRRDSKTENKRKNSRASSLKIDRGKENREERGLGVDFHTMSAQMSELGLDKLSDSDIRLRSASGQEELRNEGITPIFLSRNNTVDRRTGSGVLESALKRINVIPDTDHDTADMTHPGELLDVSEQSLPEDLSTGTQDVISSKGFVNFRRGGYSEDGSFQVRQLSPSSFPSRAHSHSHSSSALTNSKMPSSPPPYETSPFEDSPRRPESARLPAVFLSPAGDSDPERPNTAKMNAGGSPLKLFGNHDTFTNNKLLRRMSQFEETFESISEVDGPASPSLGVRRMRANRSLPSLGSETRDGQSPQKVTRPESQDAADPRMNRFGSGQLDDFFFAKEASKRINIPSRSFEDRLQYDSRLNRRSYSRGSWKDNLRKSKSLDSIPERKRSRGDGKRMVSGNADVDRSDTAGHGNARLNNTDIKRLLDTPGRNSTPKRRRTYKTSNNIEDSDLLAESVNEMSILQRNMKQRGTADAEDLSQSMRTSISPTSPPAESLWDRTPSKRATTKRNHLSMEDDSTPDDRKRSLTTQDFLDEATKIMTIIRAKGKFAGGLESVEESDLTSLPNDDGNSTEESSRENLSRPPSRDGMDMRKLREPRQLHPRVVSHLKKFADKEDTELLISSIMSLHLDKGENHSPHLDEHDTPEEGGVESSPRNIRILPPRKRKPSNHSTDDQSNHEISTMDSQDSATQNSIPTASSSSSNAKGVIASQLVSHLIPEQVNGMTYDRSSNTWVKEKATRPLPRMRSQNSEDDPFGSIPDLSVDELEEMMRNEKLISPSKKDAHHVDHPHVHPNAAESPPLDSRPRTRDGAISIPDSSSVQSKNTRFTSSGPQPETRATSWGTEDLTENIRQNSNPHSKDVEHEIQLHEGRMHTAPQRPNSSDVHPRVVTISFSSPLVSHIAYTDDDATEMNEDKSSSHGKSLYSDEVYQHSTKHIRHERSLGRHNNHKVSASTAARRTSLDGRPFVGRPISRIDEQNEDSVGDMSLVRRDEPAQVISTPLSNHLERSMMYPSSGGRDSSYNFHLSPLADFTVHQIDDPLHLDLSYIAHRSHPSSLRQVHSAFALAAEDLVKHITDTEPYEPYWEHIRRLNLRDKGLITLHRLNEFCCHLEELDVSENELGQLSGAPSTLRDLRVQHNRISNLTAWGHLINLQYLDVSSNQLETLDGFSGLIHLRELRANNNRIRNIDGVLDLNGLLHLELRKNELTDVDFEGSEMTRLNHLDLSNNRLTAVRNIDCLPSLHTVDLSTNELTTLHTSVSMPDLKSLRLSHNRLHSFDSVLFPDLQLLYLDNNDLSTIDGLNKCPHLEILSVREQFTTQSFDIPPELSIDIGPLPNIRKLFLSSNRLSERTLRPSSPALSLQLLDVASCGLKKIPDHFGTGFPNLRVLNLNFNALTELGGIAGMNGLGRLTLVGNRVSRLRMLCQILSKLGKSDGYGYSALKTIDIRGNPLTVGFYPSPVLGSGRGDSNAKLLEHTRQHACKDRKHAEQVQDAFPAIGGGSDIAVTKFANDVLENGWGLALEIDDPYTVPPADAEADQKYLSRLDESTKMRRMVLELLLYAGSGGAIKVLDGLELKPLLEGEKIEVDRIWDKLEDLGVLKRK